MQRFTNISDPLFNISDPIFNISDRLGVAYVENGVAYVEKGVAYVLCTGAQNISDPPAGGSLMFVKRCTKPSR